MSFGKRPSSAATRTIVPPPGPPSTGGDPFNRRKVFPDEVWHGKSGALLHELGIGPNDESNLIPNAASINARIEASKRRLDERTQKAQRNAQSLLPGAQLRPFFLIPDPCWNSDVGTFLMTSLDLYPHDDWNVVFLAADERTAVAMDIALHPNGNVPAFVTATEKFVTDARAHMKRATEEAELTADYAAFNNTREDVQLRVKGLAMSLARALIDAWEKQRAPDYRSPFATDAPERATQAPDQESTGIQAIVDEIRDEAEAEVKNAAFSAARSAFSAFMKYRE